MRGSPSLRDKCPGDKCRRPLNAKEDPQHKYVFSLGTDFTDVVVGHGLACSAKRYAGSRSREACDTRGRDARDTIVQRGAGRPRHDSATAAKPHGPRRKPHGPLARASLAGLAGMAATRW